MPGIELNLTPTFQRSLAKLAKQEQAVVNQAVMSFWMNPSLPGLRIHPLKLRENRFHSISPNMDLRVIIAQRRSAACDDVCGPPRPGLCVGRTT